MSTSTVTELFDALREDRWRREHPFSGEIAEAAQLLHHPYVWPDEAVECLNTWCRHHQPCFFGKFAAKNHQLHFCVLKEQDLTVPDEQIAAKIHEAKRLWKRRAVDDLNYPPHAFMLVLLSPKIALAAPDENLRRLACRIRDLAGWSPEAGLGPKDAVSHDYLYLRNPDDGMYYGFRFNVDFFAAAGDGRWWHDHRFPGGLAFTANSTGHMRYFREWYGRREEPAKLNDWFLTQAMNTVAAAHPCTPATSVENPAGGAPSRPSHPGSPYRHVEGHPANEGRVTWLRDLQDGRPLKDAKCPFTGAIPPKLQGKDWTTYEGLLHTDHAVRPEFFEDRESPSTTSQPYRMDLTYLYDGRSQDHVEFVRGVRLAEHSVYAEIGHPDEWRIRSAAPSTASPRLASVEAEVHALLERCRAWTAPES